MDDMTTVVAGILFGALGLGYLTYGRRQSRIIPLVTGVALILFPYFTPNIYIMLIAGVALLSTPYFFRF